MTRMKARKGADENNDLVLIRVHPRFHPRHPRSLRTFFSHRLAWPPDGRDAQGRVYVRAANPPPHLAYHHATHVLWPEKEKFGDVLRLTGSRPRNWSGPTSASSGTRRRPTAAPCSCA